MDWEEWLACKGHYARWGPQPGQAYQLAKEDLDKWRTAVGSDAVLWALKRADSYRMTGDNLINYLENTWPSRWGRHW